MPTGKSTDFLDAMKYTAVIVQVVGSQQLRQGVNDYKADGRVCRDNGFDGCEGVVDAWGELG